MVSGPIDNRWYLLPLELGYKTPHSHILNDRLVVWSLDDRWYGYSKESSKSFGVWKEMNRFLIEVLRVKILQSNSFPTRSERVTWRPWIEGEPAVGVRGESLFRSQFSKILESQFQSLKIRFLIFRIDLQDKICPLNSFSWTPMALPLSMPRSARIMIRRRTAF